MKRIAMIGIGSNPSTAMFSHNGGWTMALMDIIRSQFGANSTIDIVKDPEEIGDYEVIIINEGLNYFEGKWNFFGGMQQRSLDMVWALYGFVGDVYSYNERIDWPSLFKRKEIKELGWTYEGMPEVKTLNTYYGPKVIIGDSHALSIHRDGYGISRNDGATLFGSLKDGGLLRSFDFAGVSHVELYFGNIDVRFHVWRQPDVTHTMNRLLFDYLQFARKLVDQGKHVTIQGLLPIEDESRKLPGTGLYKGEKFYGTRRQRQAVVDYLNYKLEGIGSTYGIHYRGWDLPADGFEAPKFYCMEARQSVHLRPEYYLKNYKGNNDGENQTTLF